jgi:tetratricopeptide (TPR) repeat protein
LGRRNAKSDFYYFAAMPGVSGKLKSEALKNAAELEVQDKEEIASFSEPLQLEEIEYEILKIKYPEKGESELSDNSLSRRGNRSRPPGNNLRAKSLERLSETITSPEASSAEKIQALQNRARMRSGDCDFDGAIEDYIAYYSIPGNEGAGIHRQEMWGLAVTLRLRGNPPQSIAILKKMLSKPILKVEFQNEFRLALALTYDEYGEQAKTLALYDEILKSGEKRVKYETLLRRAEIYTELAENEKAIADLSAALKESSNRHQISEIYTRRATTYKQAGEIKKAIADCTGSINLDSALRDKNDGSNFSTARFLRAELEEEIGELDKALEDYAYVLENLSKSDGKRKATALWLRGRLYGMANQREKELSDILKVFYGDEPKNGFDSFVTNLKEFSKFREAYHRNDVVAKKAIADYTKLLASNQSEANRSVFLYLRGLAWRKLGESAKAEADFRLAEGLTEVPFLLEKELERVRSKH